MAVAVAAVLTAILLGLAQMAAVTELALAGQRPGTGQQTPAVAAAVNGEQQAWALAAQEDQEVPVLLFSVMPIHLPFPTLAVA